MITIDGRGSFNRGLKFESHVHHAMVWKSIVSVLNVTVFVDVDASGDRGAGGQCGRH